jgi:hypothetical protein
MVQIIGRIYKIVSSECDGCYIGSTTQQLHRRLIHHKSDYKRYLEGKYHYVTSFEVLKFVDVTIELIHEGVFDSKQDLGKLEGEVIRTTPNALNSNIAGRNVKQYQQDHAEQINTWRKTHNSCAICGGKYTNLGKAQHLRTKKHQNAVSSSSSVTDSSETSTDFS